MLTVLAQHIINQNQQPIARLPGPDANLGSEDDHTPAGKVFLAAAVSTARFILDIILLPVGIVLCLIVCVGVGIGGIFICCKF